MEESKEKHERQETYALALATMKEAYREDVITLDELVLFETMIAEKTHPYWRVSELELRMLPKK